jgi:hypothetical protein
METFTGIGMIGLAYLCAYVAATLTAPYEFEHITFRILVFYGVFFVLVWVVTLLVAGVWYMSECEHPTIPEWIQSPWVAWITLVYLVFILA